MKFCFECGYKLDDTDVFCMSCGARQDEDVATPHMMTQYQQPAPQPAPQPMPQYQQPVAQPVPQPQNYQPALKTMAPIAPKAEPPKKKKGGMVALLIILFLIILIVIGVLVYLIWQRNQDKDQTKDNREDVKNEQDVKPGNKKEQKEEDSNAANTKETEETEDSSKDASGDEPATDVTCDIPLEDIVRAYYAAMTLTEEQLNAKYPDGKILTYLDENTMNNVRNYGGELVFLIDDLYDSTNSKVLLIGQRYEDGGIVLIQAYYATDKIENVTSDFRGMNLEQYNWSELIKIEKEASTTGTDTVTADPDYVLPDSGSKLLTMDDLRGLSQEQCRIARNEIYARHGRKFKDEEVQAYFNSKSWYYGYIEPGDFTDTMLSDIENKNKDLIVKYEKEQGYR